MRGKSENSTPMGNPHERQERKQHTNGLDLEYQVGSLRMGPRLLSHFFVPKTLSGYKTDNDTLVNSNLSGLAWTMICI